MDAAHEDRMILESAFAAELARQFETAADAAARGALPARAGAGLRRWLVVGGAVALLVAVAAIIAVVPALRSGGRSGNGMTFAPSSPAPRHEKAAAAGEKAPMFYGDELYEMVPGADCRIWAWGVTHGTDKDHPGGPLLEVWDGQRWSRVVVPGNEIYGVAEPASGDLWVAVTTRRGGRLAHWNGGRWRLYPALGFVGTSEVSSALLGFSSNDVWAVGWASLDPRFPPTAENLSKPRLRNHPTALHWDGAHWRRVAMPALGRGEGEAYLRLLRGNSPDSIWALGGYTQYRRKLVDGRRQWAAVNEGEQVLLHWDGRRWTRAPLPTSQLATSRRDAFALDDMAVARDGALWCVGRRWFGPDNNGDLFVPVVLRLEGGRWQIMASSATAAPPGDWRDVMLSSISLTDEDDVWVSGRTETNGDRSVLWHWDGSSWSTIELDTSQLPGQSGVSRVLALAPEDVWALCNGSTTVKEGVERLQRSFLHFDGSAWQPVVLPQSEVGP